MNEKEVIILGSGLAGLTTAVYLARSGIRSLIVSKGSIQETNTWRAQGGVAIAYSSSDSTEKHLEDTLSAGDGLCMSLEAKKIIYEAPIILKDLLEEGMDFDKNQLDYDLGQEGGHHNRRVFHVKDRTGEALHNFVRSLIFKNYKDKIDFLDKTMILNTSKKSSGEFQLTAFKQDTQEKIELQTPSLVLATGGVGKSFLYTSNWEGATADGLKMAYDLGASIVNAEFVQFHPTCLYHPKARHFLISEALRGEGAKLENEEGKRFMATDRFPQAELSSRDIVSLAIENEIKSSGKDCVFLDISHKKSSYIKSRFEHIYKRCLSLGLDITKERIPVVPAAHYFCGGVATDSSLCQTEVSHLYAVGETAHTGLHGANRLASNSLLECMTTAKFCAEKIIQSSSSLSPIKVQRKKTHVSPISTQDSFRINALWEETRSLMWNQVGIKRSQEGLTRALNKIALISEECQSLHKRLKDHPHFVELENIIFFARVCISSALNRKESRGCHHVLDFPEKDKWLYNNYYYNNNVIQRPLNL